MSRSLSLVLFSSATVLIGCITPIVLSDIPADHPASIVSVPTPRTLPPRTLELSHSSRLEPADGLLEESGNMESHSKGHHHGH